MRKETAERIASEIIATGLGCVVALVDMTDPSHSYTDEGWRRTALSRVAQESLVGDWVVVFYEAGVKLPKAILIAAESEWLALNRTILDVMIPNYPYDDYRDGFAKWYPAKRIVRFTDEWVRVPDFASKTRPEKSDVKNWMMEHGVVIA